MRTKALVVMAAAVAMGVATATAQVVSVNVVGFINLTMKPGFNLIANQLNAPNNSNSIQVVFPNVAVGAQLFKFDSGTQSYPTPDIFDGTQWLDSVLGTPSTTMLSPGEGAFFYNPDAVDHIVTVVGEVTQGDNLNLAFPPNFSLASSIVPQQVFLVESNGITPAVGSQFFAFINGSYPTPPIYDGTQWIDSVLGTPVDVAPAVGQGFFFYNPGTTAINWTRSFHVQ